MSRIIVVEDDRYLREELVTTFERKGYSAWSISSFDEAEKEILAYAPDLAVLDLNLPGRSGFEALQAAEGKGGLSHSDPDGPGCPGR